MATERSRPVGSEHYDEESHSQFFLEAFVEYIVDSVDWRDLLTYKYFQIEDKRKFKESIDATREMLLRIMELEQPDRFSCLVSELEKAENSKVLKILKAETFPITLESNSKEALRKNLQYISDTVDVIVILPDLVACKLISDREANDIRTTYNSTSPFNAALNLMLLVTNKEEYWLPKFLLCLIQCSGYYFSIANKIDPHLTKAIERERSRPGWTVEEFIVQYRQDMSSLRTFNSFHPTSSVKGPRTEKLGSYYDNTKHIHVNVLLVRKNTSPDEQWKLLTKAYSDQCIEDGFETNFECFVDYVPDTTKDNRTVHDNENSEVQEIQLHKEQQELAAPAIEGKNVVIVAPTFSGKTRVAFKIIQEHIQRLQGHGIPKVVFLVNQVALAIQKGNECMELLPMYKCHTITGYSQRNKNEYLKDFMDKRDIFFVTAQVLLDALVRKEIESISRFSLIIFDECHHTQANHPFNQIMGLYLKLKFSKKQVDLPQIVGLTASVGVGKARDVGKAVDHIKRLMANLDAHLISTVMSNIGELREYISMPDEETKIVARRSNDLFGNNVVRLMTTLEKRMAISSVVKEMEGGDKFEKELNAPAEKGNAAYTQWVSKLWKEIAKLRDGKARKFLQPCRTHLEYYNNALIIYNDARVQDSLRYLQKEMDRWKDQARHMDQNETIIYEAYKKLKRCSYESTSENPKLEMLREMIMDSYSQCDVENSRGIVFVKTRELAGAIVSWMKDTPGLRELNPIQFVGQNQCADKGGLTKVEQDDALNFFREGKHKLIVATSVAEEGLDITKCNLVIRYDHVTNEISKVQSRGRGRAADSKYVVILKEKEELNINREIMIQQQYFSLTASVDVGKVDHIKRLMANLDAHVISTVQSKIRELRENLSMPDEETKTVARRANDVFGKAVIKLMTILEMRMASSTVVKEMAEFDKFENKLKAPAEKGNAAYTQWVSKLRNETAKLKDDKARKFLQPCRTHLEYYNNALIIYNDARVQDALRYLEQEMARWKDQALNMDQNENLIYEAYKSISKLKNVPLDTSSENPKLEMLREMIISSYSRSDIENSRGIVFVKTRELAHAIISWMKDTPGLRELNPTHFVGQNMSAFKGGMTKVEQDDALKYFREGKHKLIVATSVAEEGLDITKCNLVIRYDHVTNEISKVQSRGRGRAADSKYVVIAEENTGMAEKEELNMIREVMMRHAIIQLQVGKLFLDRCEIRKFMGGIGFFGHVLPTFGRNYHPYTDI